jgi:hypothetical protein
LGCANNCLVYRGNPTTFSRTKRATSKDASIFLRYTPDAAAFDTHLRTEHVQNFIASLSSVSTASPADLAQLDEIPVT